MTRTERLYRLLDCAGDRLVSEPGLTLWLALGGEHADQELLAEALALCGKHLSASDRPASDHQGTDAALLVSWALDQLDAEGDQRAADEEAGRVPVPLPRPTEPAPSLPEQLTTTGERVQRLGAGSAALDQAVSPLQRAAGYLAGSPLADRAAQLLEQLQQLRADVARTRAAEQRSHESLVSHALMSGERAVA